MSEHECGERCLECKAQQENRQWEADLWRHLEDAELAAYNPAEYRRRKIERLKEEQNKRNTGGSW